MSEQGDRFGDLGPERDAADRPPTAAERLAEQDRLERDAEAPEPPSRRPSSRYAWVVGVAFLIVVVVAGINSLPNEGRGVRGLEGGTRLPVFAAPLATGQLEGDANVRQGAAGDSDAGKIPACEVRGTDVVNLCQLRKKPLVLTFVFDRGADCNPQVDRVERVKDDFPDMNFAAVFFSREDRDEIREIVRRRGWTMPVALDRDGQVVNLYRVGGCPTTVFAFRGGKVMETRLGPITEDQLRSSAQELMRRSPREG